MADDQTIEEILVLLAEGPTLRRSPTSRKSRARLAHPNHDFALAVALEPLVAV